MQDLILLAHLGATLFLLGLIWVVQILSYPLFREVPEEAFRAFHEAHMRRITWLVGPTMFLEGVTALLLLAPGHPLVSREVAVLGLALIALHVASTAFVQVPLHRRLERGRESAAIERLVATNWIRTFAWTVRAALVLSVVAGGTP